MPLCLSLLHRPERTGGGRASCAKSPGHRRSGREEGERSGRRRLCVPAPPDTAARDRGELLSLPSLAKGSAPWGLLIRGRIGTENPLCSCLLLWRQRPAARARRSGLTRLTDLGRQPGVPLGKRPKTGKG